MFEFFRQLSRGIRDAWTRLSVNARVQIVLAAVVTLGLIAIAVYVGSQPQFVRLYSGLDLAESDDIVVWLESNDIEYQLRDGGQTVLVPVQNVQAARVGLADQGLPQTQGVPRGFEIFDTRDLLTNRWLQDVDFMRAVQGEAERQLNQFDFVRRAHVMIREAPDELFINEQRPSQASVMLETSRPVSKREVKAILNIVSSFGGPNLSPNNITVATADGALLHSPMEDAFTALAGGQYETQVTIENERAERVRKAFELMGRRAIVQVSAAIDWTQQETQSTQVTDGVVVSSAETSSTTQTIEAPPEGPPGALANIPEGLGRPGPITTTTETTDLVENFEPSQTLTVSSSPPGAVTKYLVSAFIEGDYVQAEGGEEAELVYQPLSDEQLATYESFIANAIGVGVENTEIFVADHPFDLDRLRPEEVRTASFGIPWYESPTMRLVIQALLIFGAFLVIRSAMRRAMVLPAVEEEEVAELPEASAEDTRRREVAAEVERLTKEDPATVANLLRTWLSEED